MNFERSLLECAQKAMKNAYSPYSKLKVGAAVLAKSGSIYLGCNVENVSYGITMCAERNAIAAAIAAGEKAFTAIAVVSDSSVPIMPCGACRQVLAEFVVDTVLVGDIDDWQAFQVKDLLPYLFTKEQIK